jgi:hypothetical protein
MTYSTSTAIREALESTIAGLDPPGEAKGVGEYTRAAAGFDWEDRPDIDIDRTFTIELIGDGTPLMFGTISEIDYTGEFTIMIGHAKTADIQDGLDRRNTDIDQIRKNLEKRDNFPSGVSLMRFVDRTDEETEDYWIDEITFRIVYALVAP